MSTHSIGFKEEITKLGFNSHQISSSTHIICSSIYTQNLADCEDWRRPVVANAIRLLSGSDSGLSFAGSKKRV